jgi:hypothetical protein
MSASVATASSKSGRLPPAAQYVDIIGLIKRLGARNDLAKAMVTRAALHQGAGDVSAARELLEHAYAIFQVLDRGRPTRSSGGRSLIGEASDDQIATEASGGPV